MGLPVPGEDLALLRRPELASADHTVLDRTRWQTMPGRGRGVDVGLVAVSEEIEVIVSRSRNREAQSGIERTLFVPPNEVAQPVGG